MKKLLTILMLPLLLLSLTACGNQVNRDSNTPNMTGGVSAEVIKLVSNKSANSPKLHQSIQEFEVGLGKHDTPEQRHGKSITTFAGKGTHIIVAVSDPAGKQVTQLATTKEFQADSVTLDSKSPSVGYENESLALSSLTAFIPSDATVVSETRKKIGKRQEIHTVTMASKDIPSIVLYTIEKDNRTFEAMLTTEEPTIY